MSEIRICQFLKLIVSTSDGALANKVHLYQNYFINEQKSLAGETYDFAAFQAEGALASLNGDNQQLRVLFPNQEIVIRFVEEGNGNRLTVLALSTAWLNAAGVITTYFTDYFVGIGASFSEETVELRFRSSMDSVGASFPARILSVDNVGTLPLNAELYLR
jgi:hypothetical protein